MYSHSDASNTTISLYCYCKENNCHHFRQTERYPYGMKSSFLGVHVVCVCVSGFNLFFCVSILYYLLSQCTIEHFLAFRWWYACHSLINPAIDESVLFITIVSVHLCRGHALLLRLTCIFANVLLSESLGSISLLPLLVGEAEGVCNLGL
jgi:hypothetical protein